MPDTTGNESTKIRFRPIVRVFVSSTFNDLKFERNALAREVFPKLEHYCLVRGFQFEAIDLRWGVPSEAGRDHRTMRLCFEELRRAQEASPRPNFLVLLGDRYGWQPLAEWADEDEFGMLTKAAAELDSELPCDRRSPASASHIVATWYRRDENADPVRFVLRSRFDLPAPTPATEAEEDAAWKKVEAVLWAVVNRAFPPKNLAGRFAHIPPFGEPLPSIVKFQTSATEQEIWRGALAVPDAFSHVVAWTRTIRNRANFAADTRLKDFCDLQPGISERASELRAELRRHLGETDENKRLPAVVDLRVSADGKRLEVTPDHLESMSVEIESRLRAIIDEAIREYWQSQPASGRGAEAAATRAAPPAPSEARKLELENQAHKRFGQRCAPDGGFIGRQQELERIATYLTDTADRKPLVVFGPSGAGKTALLARAGQIASDRFSARVTQRFLGTTPDSSNLQSLLTSLCRALSADPEPNLPFEVRLLQEELDRLLATATVERPILLFLDGIDQLDDDDGARQAYWLRTPLAEYVRVVVSCTCYKDTPEHPDPLNVPYRTFERRELLGGAISVDSLTEEEATQAIDLWLANPRPGEGKRAITSAQREAVTERVRSETACRRPLYLRILAEEARQWPSWLSADQIRLGASTAELLGAMLTRIENKSIHGPELVMACMGYLAAARRGLSQNEMLEVLWADKDYRSHLEEQSRETNQELPEGSTRIPIAIWSRLRHDLAPYLSERNAPGGTVLAFYHLQVGRCVRENAKSPWTTETLHTRLADYFHSQDYWTESADEQRSRAKTLPPTPRPANVRKVDELPWQTLQAATLGGKDDPKSPLWDRVADLLTDWRFIEAKTEAQP